MKPRNKPYICGQCRLDRCGACVDILRAVYTDTKLCTCKRKKHSGEPVEQQILDPETGAVHAPGLIVTKDGEVIRK